MLTADTASGVAAQIQQLVPPGARRVIGIDGVDGAGKTTLGRQLASLLASQLLSLDDFIEKNQGAYMEYLRTAALASAIASAIAIDGSVIVEGVCLVAALDTVGATPDVLVYVKRMSGTSGWIDTDRCDSAQSLEEVLAEQTAEMHDIAGFLGESGKLPALQEELIRYHHAYRPSRRASIEFLVPA